VYDFLLVINSNLGPIHTVSEIWQLINQKSQIFPNPHSFTTLTWGDPCGIYGKALWFLKLESSRQPTVEIW